MPSFKTDSSEVIASKLQHEINIMQNMTPEFPIVNIDPYFTAKKIERLLSQLETKQDTSEQPKKESTYQDRLIDGLANALAILHDDIKAQQPTPIPANVDIQPAEDQLALTIPPWEQWPNDQENFG